MSNLLQRSGLSREEGRELLLPAWEAAVARQLDDVGIDLDREAALLYYARHFDLDDAQLDHHGMLRQLVQGACKGRRENVPRGRLDRRVWAV